MTDVLACDTPIRPIRPGDAPPPAEPPAEVRPKPTSFSEELHKIFAALLNR